MSDKTIDMFQSDFKVVADYFVQMRENYEYQPAPEKIRHVQEVLQLLNVMTRDDRFEEAVREDQVMHYLMEHVQIPDYQAKLCASFAQGSIGKAMELATSEDFRELRELAISAARKIGGMDVSEISETVETIASHKAQIWDFLDLLAVWYRDVLVFKATRSPDSLVFKDQIQAVRQSASIISYEGLEAILRALDTAKVRLDANAGFDLTMQLLLLTMHDYSK